MRDSKRTRVGIFSLLFVGGIIVIPGGCADQKPTAAPAEQTTVEANKSNSSAWEQVKPAPKAAKK